MVRAQRVRAEEDSALARAQSRLRVALYARARAQSPLLALARAQSRLRVALYARERAQSPLLSCERSPPCERSPVSLSTPESRLGERAQSPLLSRERSGGLLSSYSRAGAESAREGGSAIGGGHDPALRYHDGPGP